MVKTTTTIFAFGAALLVGVSAAWAWEMPILKGDIFDKKPAAADASGKPACAAAKKYVDLINAGRYSELGSLWADDGVFLAPDGKFRKGPKEITAFYAEFLSRAKPDIVPISFMADGNECVMELAAKTSETGRPNAYVLGAIDHFTVNAEGKVVQMIPYMRPKPAPATPAAQ